MSSTQKFIDRLREEILPERWREYYQTVCLAVANSIHRRFEPNTNLDDTIQRIVSALPPNERSIFSEMCDLLGKAIDETPDDVVALIHDELKLSDNLAMYVKAEDAQEFALQGLLDGSETAFETLPIYLNLGAGSSNVIRVIFQELERRGINAEQNLYCFIEMKNKKDHLSPLMAYLTLCKYRVSAQITVGETFVLCTIAHFVEGWHERLEKTGQGR